MAANRVRLMSLGFELLKRTMEYVAFCDSVIDDVRRSVSWTLKAGMEFIRGRIMLRSLISNLNPQRLKSQSHQQQVSLSPESFSR